jgi:dinuclear metal center YbgI/SA1388 family protein
MPNVAEIIERLEAFAPPHLAEEWDNVGLLWGDRQQPVDRMLTCLTLGPAVAREAIDRQVQLVVTHHPLPFQPLRQVTTDTATGSLLWQLARAGISVYSPHTSFDSTSGGINDQLATALELSQVVSLVPSDRSDGEPSPQGVGAGRIGTLGQPTQLRQLAERLMSFLGVDHIRLMGEAEREVELVAIACGSGGSLFDAAAARGAQVVVTGEASFHSLLSLETAGAAALLTGHYASERFALEWLAGWLADQFPACQVEASRQESDPLRLIVREGGPR